MRSTSAFPVGSRVVVTAPFSQFQNERGVVVESPFAGDDEALTLTAAAVSVWVRLDNVDAHGLRPMIFSAKELAPCK